ncbi:PilZ domain-containing protein [Croceibacterium ferulae]|uniref:PilZ domain-containing protein n=1 Tax=Croceibacterium ferulae TaxID=1854641 RepID=UPI000EB0D7A8|nr:PilZ domain-containing protein [Croceibacterium ferulae]
MTNVDTRQVQRDSMFLLARLRVEEEGSEHQVRVRNLSAGGMMAEGQVDVVRGTAISVELRTLGWVRGTVAWRQDGRFGIAFAQEIDPTVVRVPVGSKTAELESPRYTRTPAPVTPTIDPNKLRRV